MGKLSHRLLTDFHGTPFRSKRDKIRAHSSRLEISASKITAFFFCVVLVFVFWVFFFVKTVLRFLELVTGENIFIVHDVYLDSFPLIACFGLGLWEPLQSVGGPHGM